MVSDLCDPKIYLLNDFFEMGLNCLQDKFVEIALSIAVLYMTLH